MSEEVEHSLRGPSGAHRWRRCPGSLNAESNYPDKVGKEAAQGTVFHEYAAMCLMFGLDPHDFPVGVVHEVDGYEIEYDEDMVRYMYEGLDYVRENVEDGDILLIERRVNISPWCGEKEFGTADVIIIKVNKRTIVNFDWKYGKGVPVSPVKNDQMYLYNLGSWNDYAEKIFRGVDSAEIEVVFFIEQPRAPGGGGEWRTTMEECFEEGKRIREDALATMSPHAPRIAGEKQCLFCKASGNCREQAIYLLDVMGQKFEDIDDDIDLGVGPAFDTPDQVPRQVRSFVLLHRKAFNRWVDKIHALTLYDLKAGKEVPLLKAVAGRPGRRAYMENHLKEAETDLVELVGEEKAFETKLIPPAVAEKLVGKKKWREKMAGYCEQPQGKPLLVPVEDKREPLQDFASKYEDFEDEEDSENGDE
jgi:hypothetical protein